MDACSIEFDAGPEALIMLSSLAFYAPPEVSLRMDLVGSAFQTGDCNITLPRRVMPSFTSDWQTVWALEVQPSVGWNQRTFDPPLHFERLRLLGPQGLGGCRVRELSMRGHVIVKPPMGCPVEVTVSNAAPAVAVADEAPLDHLVLDAKAVGAGQLQLSPRGSVSFWLSVAAAVTDSPQLQIEAAVLPDEHWPLQSDEMTFLSDGEAAMTWSDSFLLPSRGLAERSQGVYSRSSKASPEFCGFIATSSRALEGGDLLACTCSSSAGKAPLFDSRQDGLGMNGASRVFRLLFAAAVVLVVVVVVVVVLVVVVVMVVVVLVVVVVVVVAALVAVAAAAALALVALVALVVVAAAAAAALVALVAFVGVAAAAAAAVAVVAFVGAVVLPRLDMTPLVMSIVPSHGPFSGGTSLILGGSGFLCNETSAIQDISVVLRGTRCAVSFATDSEIHCTTGAASSMGGKAEPEVIVAGCGKSMSATWPRKASLGKMGGLRNAARSQFGQGTPPCDAIRGTRGNRNAQKWLMFTSLRNIRSFYVHQVTQAATATFTYVSRWSDPTDWPFNEPPISTDQTWIPPGSHVILDVPTEPLGLLRLEGHLQMDLHAEDLSLRAERIWVRGGALMAEPSGEEESNMTRLERQSANFSIVMAPARIMNQVTSVPVEVPGNSAE
eukprot:s1391_g3.t3